MNKKEVLELKRRFKKDAATFTRLVGCYVDANHNKVCKFGGKFLNLEEEEYYKYLEIANKALSGTLGNNLLELHFPLEEEEVGGRQQILMALRESKLEDENLLDTYYDLVIDTYDHTGNYLILLYHDAYDVMTRTSDNNNLDESEEVYSYLICAICPVALSKPGLGYLESEQRIGSRVRDWVVGVPDTAFLFPAFNDRSTDIHSALFYTKNTKEPHSEFMANGLGCSIERTATEQKMAFHSIVRNVLGAEDEATEGLLMDIQQNLSYMIDEYEDTHDEEDDAFVLDKTTMQQLLEESNISEEKASRIEKKMDEAFGDKLPVAEHVIDAKALQQNVIRLERQEMESQISTLYQQLSDKNEQLEERTSQLLEKQEEMNQYMAQTHNYDVVLHVKPEKANQIHSSIINGQKCLVIPMEDDEQAAINGVAHKEDSPMINTIIFDIGNVLVDFCWKEYFISRGFEGEAFEKIANATVRNDAWNEFDKGLISTEEIIEIFAKEAPEYKKQIAEIYDHLPDMLKIYDYAYDWVCGLKKQGYKVYALSNWSKPAYDTNLDTNLRFLSEMDGAVISFQEGIIKPNPEIYKRICDRYQINPAKAVFIDDNANNIRAAKEFGLNAILFENYTQACEELHHYLNNKD